MKARKSTFDQAAEGGVVEERLTGASVRSRRCRAFGATSRMVKNGP